MTKKVILLLSVITLFCLCIFKTYDVLGIGKYKQESSEEIEVTDEDNRVIKNNSNPNSYQDEDTGMRLFSGEKIYYNTPNYLMTYDVFKDESNPLLAGVAVKCMADADDAIYGVTTMPNANGIDCDYLMKVMKDDGNTTTFYKTECPHITSVIFDGQYVYYTNESHTIYRVDGQDVVEWDNGNKSADYPVIIGIYNDGLYITDGTQIEEINIKTGARKAVYTQLCSAMQKPIMVGADIYMFTNFNQNGITRFNIDTKASTELVSKKYVNATARADKINSFSATENVLFFNCEGRLYMVELTQENNPKFCRYINTIESSSFEKYLFYIEDEQINVFDVSEK